MTEPTREQRIDAAMVRLDRDGMIAAFENDYGQKWTDPEWRTEVSIWAAAWRRGRAAMAAGKDASPLAGSIGGGEVPLLAQDHKGMRADYRGLLGQCQYSLKANGRTMFQAEGLRQLEEHLTELGQRWYAGDTAVVDEILQLYCIEREARKDLAAHGIRALPGPDSQQPHVALPRDGGTDKLGGC